MACVALTPEFICTDGVKASIPLHNPGILTSDKVKPLLGKIYIYINKNRKKKTYSVKRTLVKLMGDHILQWSMVNCRDLTLSLGGPWRKFVSSVKFV